MEPFRIALAASLLFTAVQAQAAGWSQVESPNSPPSPTDNFSSGVACVSATRCWAVGYYSYGGIYQALIQRWDGSAWTLAEAPVTSPTQNNLLRSVACTSASQCWAVGTYSDGNYNQTLVEHWDGTNWSDLGSGVANARSKQLVSALLPTQDALWVGGRFSWAGQKPSANIARWIESPQLGMTRRFDKNDKNKKVGRLEFRVDLGMRGHLETSTDLLNWTTVPDAHDDSSDWQIDAPDSPGKWFYRFALER